VRGEKRELCGQPIYLLDMTYKGLTLKAGREGWRGVSADLESGVEGANFLRSVPILDSGTQLVVFLQSEGKGLGVVIGPYL